MRSTLPAPRALSAFAVAGLLGCYSDAVSPPNPQSNATLSSQTASATAVRANGRREALVVDNDRLDCPRADYTSIQAAVTDADPGSTIMVCAGTYVEWVVIENKDNLRLLAKGKPGTVILDGQNVAGANCSPASTTSVQCAGFELRNADDNVIEGFLVKRYWEAGIWLRLGSSGNTIRKNVTTESPHHDGIQVANSANNVIEHNVSFDNFSPGLTACGINVAGAASVGNIVRHNETFGNDFGIQVADAGATTNNVIIHNESHNNRRLGMRIVFANGTTVENNRLWQNTEEGIRDTVSNGTKIENNRVLDNGKGITVRNSTDVLVARNRAFGNTPDLFWDESGAVVFRKNHCGSSVPPGLCSH
jgi:parallel beta-helix repeat protein